MSGAAPWQFLWWGPNDNLALLRAYNRRGAYLYRQNRVALRAFTEEVNEASDTDVDFTVRVSITAAWTLFGRLCSPTFEKGRQQCNCSFCDTSLLDSVHSNSMVS